MRLYIRDKSCYVNFVHDVKELREFIGSYQYGTSIVLGDVALFSGQMRSMLLKFVEDNPAVDVFSSVDILDAVLLSRFPLVQKEPLSYKVAHDEKGFMSSDRRYLSAAQHLGISANSQLIAVGASDIGVSLLCIISGRVSDE